MEIKLQRKKEEEEMEQCGGQIRKFSINLQSTEVDDENVNTPL